MTFNYHESSEVCIDNLMFLNFESTNLFWEDFYASCSQLSNEMIYVPCQVLTYEIVDLNYTFHHKSHVYTYVSPLLVVSHTLHKFDRLDGPSNHRGVNMWFKPSSDHFLH